MSVFRDVGYKDGPTLTAQAQWLPTLRQYSPVRAPPPPDTADGTGDDDHPGSRALVVRQSSNSPSRYDQQELGPYAAGSRRQEETETAMISLAAARQQREKAAKELHRLQQRHLNPQPDGGDIHSMKATLRKMHQVLQQGEKQAQQNHRTVQQHISTIKQDVNGVHSEIDALEHTVAVLQGNCDRSHEEVRVLRQELAERRSERDSLATAMQNMLTAMRRDVEAARVTIASQDVELARLQEQNSFLTVQCMRASAY